MTLWLGKEPLVLASQSKARQMLLAKAGIAFETDPADIDERAIQASSGLSAPGEIAGLLAREKAFFVSRRQPARYVIGADQTLALGLRILNKPAGRAQAADQLRELAGHRHELHRVVTRARAAPMRAARTLAYHRAQRDKSQATTTLVFRFPDSSDAGSSTAPVSRVSR